MTIDTRYRPSSYFWAADKGIKLSSDIQGAARRGFYERAVALGDQEAARNLMQHADLSAEEHQAWGRMHPWMMGGEYLPKRAQAEVEIARINIASTTCDVTSVYARQGRHRIHYRVVDEYEGMTLNDVCTRTSVKPLTLQQLVDFFFGAWNLLDVLDVNFADHGYPRGRTKAFILDASSNFYAEFGDEVNERVERWLDEKENLLTQ